MIIHPILFRVNEILVLSVVRIGAGLGPITRSPRATEGKANAALMSLVLVMRVDAALVLMLCCCWLVAPPYVKSSISVIAVTCVSGMEGARERLIQVGVSSLGRVGVRPTVTNCVLQKRVHSGIVHAQLMAEGQPERSGEPPVLQARNSMSCGRGEMLTSGVFARASL